MSDHLSGGGDVYQDGQTESSGTWQTSGFQDNTLSYDDNPAGPGGNDKTFEWLPGPSTYVHPGGANLATGTSRVDFTYLGVIEGKKTWRWSEYSRGSKDDPWPSQPTATGKITKN